MVTSDFQGTADVQIKLHIGQNGLVEHLEIVRTTNSGIGERIAASARNWIFSSTRKGWSGVPGKYRSEITCAGNQKQIEDVAQLQITR